MSKRRQSQPTSGHYAQKISRCLEKVSRASGYHPPVVFQDWLQVVEACLDTLPAHLTALVESGRLAEDPLAIAQTFSQLRFRYPPKSDNTSQDVWSLFSQAFALLLDSAAPGLWAYTDDQLGPDVLGQIYQTYVYPPGPSRWNAAYYTPWTLARTLACLNISDGARLVHERLKQACQHPDNILAQATLLTGLTIDDPQEARTWFFNYVLPASFPHYTPIRVGDPAGVGSGVLLLAAATAFPDWAVLLNLVTFSGVDNDPIAVKMARINCALYGLNGYFLKFVPALQTLYANEHASVLPPRSPTEAYQQAVNIYKQRHPTNPPPLSPSFEELFKQTT
ncbi:MAG: hypothetical protein KDJ65_11680 [Anaerolineae bacterium]|nr:hypothetical protein [Anaerolineae bacterium]